MASKDQARYSPEAWARKMKRQAEYAKEHMPEISARSTKNRRARPAQYNAVNKLWRTRNPEKVQSTRLRNSYGISLDDYNELLTAQGGVCAICHKPETRKAPNGKIRMLAVDHDHKRPTMWIRSLLCHSCNSGIGLFDECPDRLRAAALYLEQNKRTSDGK